MIEGYYEARGLDTSGLLSEEQIEDLHLGVQPPATRSISGVS
jgi:hypothetical protein